MDLTPEQQAEADRLYEHLRKTTDADLRARAELLASKGDGELLGKTEFEVRDRVHRIGAKAFETALDERKKGATRAPAPDARPATGPASSSGDRADRSSG